jgi:amicoumacin kinase
MEASVERVFSKKVIELTGDFFGVNTEEAVKLGDAENYVFEVYRDGVPYILRLTHESHRTKEQVMAEVMWVEYLRNNGSHIPKVIPSIENNLVEVAKGLDGSEFYSCLFEKAPGVRMKITDENFDENLFFEWGRTIGQLHRLTKSYTARAEYKRLSWDDEELLNIRLFNNEAPIEVVHQQERLMKKLNTLPVHKNNFGLIHSDIHHGNFHYHQGKIYVFDFDDASNHWFASDLAIPLYYCMWSLEHKTEKDRHEHAIKLMRNLIKGYETENQLALADYETIPLFLKVRDLTLYSFFYKKYDMSSSDIQLNKTVERIEQRIKENRCIVDIDLRVVL